MTIDAHVRIVREWVNILASYSAEPRRLPRQFATAEPWQTDEVVATWMHNLGMAVRRDNMGNIIGRYETDYTNAKTLQLGSHLNIVQDGWRFDGTLSTIIALACIQRLHDRKQRLPFALELISFADEKAARYHTAYLSSKVVTSSFNPANLKLLNTDRVSMRENIRGFGGDPNPVVRNRRNKTDLLGYIEVHIEQNLVLEPHNLLMSVVSAIAGQSHFVLSFGGESEYVDTLSTVLPQDALYTAAEFVLAVEQLAQQVPGLVATVGQLMMQSDLSNVVPGCLWLSLDVRHQNDITRSTMCAWLHEQAARIAESRQVMLNWYLVQEQNTVPCSQELSGLLAQAIEALGYPVSVLPGAVKNDAAVMANIIPIATLLVSCKGGTSHNLTEAVTIADMVAATRVLEQFLERLAERTI